MGNPFANLDEFEALRRAALDGEEAFQRFRRRESAIQRRNASQATPLVLSSRIDRMVETAISASRAVLLVGPPGTGKTEIIEQLIERIDADPTRWDFGGPGVQSVWVTPEEEWSFETLVLGETVVDGEIVTVEGDLLKAVRTGQWLVLDETNRADMDRVLGGVLTWLSGKRVQVGALKRPGREPLPVYLDWTDQPESSCVEIESPPSMEYRAGTDWRLLGTYNAVDAQRVFRMGQALSRRFKHVPIPPASAEDFAKIIQVRVAQSSFADWIVNKTTNLYEAHLAVPDASLGPGLFVDIPAYIEHGLRMSQDAVEPVPRTRANDDTGADADPDSEGPTIGDAVGEPVERTNDIVASTAPRSDRASLLEELLAEAYMISVGTFVAKYEPDVLDQLSYEISNREALTAANWVWMSANLHAMRA